MLYELTGSEISSNWSELIKYPLSYASKLRKSAIKKK